MGVISQLAGTFDKNRQRIAAERAGDSGIDRLDHTARQPVAAVAGEAGIEKGSGQADGDFVEF